MLGIRTQGKIGYSGTRTQINVVLTITLNTPGSVFLTPKGCAPLPLHCIEQGNGPMDP